MLMYYHGYIVRVLAVNLDACSARVRFGNGACAIVSVFELREGI